MCSLSETCKTISDFSNCLKKLFYFLFHELLFESEVLSTSKFENLFVFEFIDSKKNPLSSKVQVCCVFIFTGGKNVFEMIKSKLTLLSMMIKIWMTYYWCINCFWIEFLNQIMLTYLKIKKNLFNNNRNFPSWVYFLIFLKTTKYSI